MEKYRKKPQRGTLQLTANIEVLNSLKEHINTSDKYAVMRLKPVI